MVEPPFVNEHKWNGIVKAGEQEIEPKNNIVVYKKMGKMVGAPDKVDEDEVVDSPYRIK